MKKNLLLLFLALFLSSTSCSNESAFEDPSSSEKQDDRPTLNFLGDSIFALWRTLGEAFPEYHCNNYGWSAKGINTFLGRVDVTTLAGTECVVEIGTNDMRNVINSGSVDSYIEHYIDVLSSWKAQRIYLLSLLPRNRAKDNGYDFNSHYPEINEKIRTRIEERMDNVIYIPLYEIFLKDGQINWEYTNDGLHPNTKGYEVMAAEIRKYLVKS